jgi:hypothetical protein
MPALALLVLLLLQGAAPDAPARRELLRAFLGARAASDLEREAELGAEIEAARAGAGEPWSALLERALAWSAADVAALRATETRLRELRHAAQLPDAAALEALRREAEASGADALFTAEWGALGHHLGELERSDEAVALVTWSVNAPSTGAISTIAPGRWSGAVRSCGAAASCSVPRSSSARPRASTASAGTRSTARGTSPTSLASA